MKHLTAATAGHVDHGKSALVKALTGADPDRLPEEKARGITIDLGFTRLDLETVAGLCCLGLVDVPGHEDFVRNMVAGVGSVDLALLIVAADDGWMPQTEEHMRILTYLGVRRGVVALTKMDLVGEGLSEAQTQTRGRLAGTFLAHAPIVPVSSRTGAGLEALKTALIEQISNAPTPRDAGRPRLPVDRAFVLRGVGTVVTGTLNGGSLERGQTAVIQPTGIPTRLRSIQCHGADVSHSTPGRRTALNLVDLPGPEAVHRGDVLTVRQCGPPTTVIDARVSIAWRDQGPLEKALKTGTRLRVHHGSASAAARLFLLDGQELSPSEPGLAQLRLESPLMMFGGDRFVLRDWAEQKTLAGGVVLDPRGAPRRFRTNAQRRLLRRRAEAVADVGVWVESELERDKVLSADELLGQTGFGSDEIAASVAELARQGKASRAGEWITEGAWWREQQNAICAAVDQFHSNHPERAGLPVAGLTPNKLIPQKALDLLIDSLAVRGYLRVKTVIRRAVHRPRLPPHLAEAGKRIREALAGCPVAPPAKKELASDGAGQQALRFLLETGELLQLSEEVVLLAETKAKMEERVITLLQRGAATVSELRQLLGTTRRILVPLLEHLDRAGVTSRQGDRRVLGPRAGEKRS